MSILRSMFLASLLLFSAFVSCSMAAPPAIPRQMEIINATIEGGGPLTIDPAACYDTASGELLMNVYDTLVFFDGEQVDNYIPQLADNWTSQNITGTTSPDGVPWYFRYTFHIRPNVHFWNGDTLTPEDVEYCFERGMILEGNPQWMFYEPLLNTWGALGLNTTALEGNSTEQSRVGAIINHSVESNGTHVWFNLVFPGAYAPFMQILSQPWSSVYSKAWALGLDRPSNWDGDWSDWYSHWLSMRYPALPPFDDPTPVAMGTGPFVFEELNNSLQRWSGLRNHDYWRGWPLDWPGFGSSRPAGYIEHFVVTWAYDWSTRSTMFLNGEVDFCAVPRQYLSQVQGQPGVRSMHPLPSLYVDAVCFQFNIAPNTWNNMLPSGTFNESGVPPDFFSNSTWGIHVRKAFASVIDYDSYISSMYLGEAVHPATVITPALPYYDPTVKGYSYNLTRAEEELKQVPGLWDTGFSLTLFYTMGSLPRQPLHEFMANSTNSLNSKFHVQAAGLDWASYFTALNNGQLPLFIVGWVADYPDPHNLAYPYYYTSGNFASRCHYSNPQMDGLIDEGIRTPDGPERAEMYRQIQQLAVEDCPNIATVTAVSRHFERTWVCGWYYNLAYPGVYAANLWKRYYTPHAQLDKVANDTSNLLSYDVNYDGIVNIVDIASVAHAFGSSFGPPLHPRWNFRMDVNNDRLVNIVDIVNIATYFGRKSAVWVPS